MSEILVREYQPGDREAVERCIFELQEDEYARRPHYWAEPSEALASIYLSHTLKSIEGIEDSAVYVVEVNDKVAGWIVASVATEDGPDVALKRYGYISEVAVLREYQKKGLGSVLMKKAEEFIKSKDLEWMELNVSKGSTALEFYKKFGYKESSIRMEKKLD